MKIIFYFNRVILFAAFIFSITKLGFAQTIVNNPNSSITITCPTAYKFFDIGGVSGTYGANRNQVTTFCAPAGQSVRVVFYDFQTENGYDKLFVYNGSTTGAPLLGTYSGNGMPLAFHSAIGGCITFRFTSDASFNNFRGFAADVNCGFAPSGASSPDCASKGCLSQVVNVNSGNTGSGGTNDLPNATVRGCLSVGELNTSWFFVDILTAGTFRLFIYGGGKDYDFAVYQKTNATTDYCPTSAPVRCSFSAPAGTTGIDTPLDGDGLGNIEDLTGDNWVPDLNVVAGDRLVIVVGDYTNSSASSAIVSVGGTATLGCLLALPIELISFNGIANNQNIIINWKTATENSNDFFLLERSANAIDFEEIAKIKGAGNSTKTLNYLYTDTQPLTGINYYRLKQINFDKSFEYSDFISIEFDSGNTNMKNVRPNPTSGNINFDFYTKQKGFMKIQILDYMGGVINNINQQVEEGKTMILMDLTPYPQGVYTLKIICDNYTNYERVIQN